MDVGMQLGQSQRLEQNISPQMLQSIAILQKNSLELETAIKQEIESNPLLELDESMPDDSVESPSQEEDDYGQEREESISEMDFERGTLEDSADTDYDIYENSSGEDWVKRLEDGANDADAPFKDLNAAPQDADEAWDRPQKDRDASLQDRLREQLREWNGTHELLEQLRKSGCTEGRFRELVEYLIDSLDENGFLQGVSSEDSLVRESNDPLVNEIETMLRGEKPLDECSLPVREAVHVLQGFTPRGIGARDQRECFMIQAYAIPNFPPLGIRILENCYEDLLSLRYAKIAKALGVSSEEVQQAVASFARLNPHPGFQLSNARIQTVAADLKVVEKHGRMEVESVRSSMQKRLRVNQTYKAILDDKGASKSDKEYVRTHLFKAVEFIKALDNRYSTMELVMRAIFKRQKDFFTKGPAFLKPMVQQDIADDIKRDVSTVNRSINGKYVDTPYGVYELKRFFTSGVKQDSLPGASGEELSSATILDAIKKLVDAEDKKKPLSDQAISDKLAEQGIQVARRTVAKYREKELRILPASQRKKLI